MLDQKIPGSLYQTAYSPTRVGKPVIPTWPFHRNPHRGDA